MARVQVASDNFNRTDGGLGANWTTGPGEAPQISSNHVVPDNDDADAPAFYSGATFGASHYAQATFTWGNGGASYAGLIVRANATDMVIGQKDAGTGDAVIVWYNGGGYTEIGRSPHTFVNGSVLRLEAIGDLYFLYDDGELITYGRNASAPSTGKPGLVANRADDNIDDWSGGDFSNTIARMISTGSDDAEEAVTSTVVSIDSGDMEITNDGGTQQLVGLRFNNITIPNTATITNARLMAWVSEAQTGSNSPDVYGQAADDASTFAASNTNISARSLTTANVDWPLSTNIGSVTLDVVESPDIKTVVQEIISRGGWSSGNDIVFVIKNGDATNRRTWEAYDAEPNHSFGLYLEYSTAVSVTPTPAALNATAAVVAPTVVAVKTVTPAPAALNVTAAVVAPTVVPIRNVTPTPAAIDLVGAIVTPTITVGDGATPAPLDLVSAVVAPTVIPLKAISTLSDNFNDNSIASLWTSFGTGVLETNQQLELTNGSAYTDYLGLFTDDKYDLTGGSIYVKVVNAGNQALASLQVLFQLQLTIDDQIEFVIEDNFLKAFTVVGGVTTLIGSMVAYDSTDHAYLRISEDSGDIIWEVSPDAISWNAFTDTPNPFAVKQLQVNLIAGTFASEATSTKVIFDSLNTTIASATVTPSALNLTGTLPEPTLVAQTNITVTPSALNMTAAIIAPTAGAIQNATITPDPLALASAVLAASVTANGAITVAIGSPVGLTGTVVAPTVVPVRNVTIAVAVPFTILMAQPAADAVVATGVTVTPSPVNMTGAVGSPGVYIGTVNVTVSPATLNIQSTVRQVRINVSGLGVSGDECITNWRPRAAYSAALWRRRKYDTCPPEETDSIENPPDTTPEVPDLGTQDFISPLLTEDGVLLFTEDGVNYIQYTVVSEEDDGQDYLSSITTEDGFPLLTEDGGSYLQL